MPTCLYYLLLSSGVLTVYLSHRIVPRAARDTCATPSYDMPSLLTLEGTWSVELPLVGDACLQTFGDENKRPHDTVTFTKSASGFTARSTRGNVAALGGCSCQTIDFGTSERGSPLPRDAPTELAVTYDIPTVYDGALVGTVQYCATCVLRAQSVPNSVYCSMFTDGGADMEQYCTDMTRRGGRYDPSRAGIKSTSYTKRRGAGTCCMTYQHASVLVSSAENASELVLLTVQDEAQHTKGCGRLTVLRRSA